ncbi:MAG: LamG-like jellyroll fold domain-containing protein [Salinibacter sp.]
MSLILLLCALGASSLPQGARAQTVGETPPTRRAGTVANLFETLDPSSPINGARLQLPDDWRLKEVHLFRYGTKPVPVQHRSLSDNTVLFSTASPIQGPHELVLRVQVGNQPGTREWHLTPFVRSPAPNAPDSLSQRTFRTIDRRTQRIKINSRPRPTGSNRALDLTGAERPVLTDLPPRLVPDRDHPFTIEFWMRTGGLDQVPLSSWTGEETTAYPFEFVVDPSGHLRSYYGRAGHHKALRSMAPVADGRWHHVAVTYAPSANRLRLLLDGTTVDSLRPQAFPSVSGALPIALGGRRPSPTGDTSGQSRFTGRLDEIRIWTEIRSGPALHNPRTRPQVKREEKKEPGPFRLDFNAAAVTEELQWPEGARRVPTTLSFRSPLRGLRAHTDGQSVTLRWMATAADEGTFIVERSPNGRSFTKVEELSPLDSEPSSGDPQEIVYTDSNVPGNVVYYRVRQVSSDTERTTRTIKIGLGADTSSTETVNLIGNFPNPFRESTTIAYRVKKAQTLTLSVWNLAGKRVATLADGKHTPGYYERTFTANNLPSGSFFVRLESARGVQSDRMVLLK